MPLLAGESFLQAEARRKREDRERLPGPTLPTPLRKGESFLQASARRKREDRERLSNPEAKAWAATRSIFVPPAFTKPPPRAKPGKELPSPAALVRSAEERREFSLGLTKRKQAPNISDAVQTAAEKRRAAAQERLDNPPVGVREDAAALRRWRRGFIQQTGLSRADKTALRRDAEDEFRNATRPINFGAIADIGEGVGRSALGVVRGGLGYIEPATAFVPRGNQFGPTHLARDEVTREQIRARAETALETGLGRAPTNLLLHGDLPGTWGQAGGLAAGIATIGPGGKVVRAGALGGKALADAVRAGEGLRVALRAGGEAGSAAYHGPSATGQIIRWAKTGRKEGLSPAQVEAVRSNAGMIVAARNATREAGDHASADQLEGILAQAGLGPHGEFHGWDPKTTLKRVKSKLNEKNRAKGVPYKNPTILNEQGIHVAGPFTNEQWVEKVLAAFPTAAERHEWAKWYEEFAPAFREAFGPLAEDLMRGFSVSQANQSPTGGLQATLRVLDRLQAGDTPETIAHLGIATKSLVKTIAKAVEGEGGKVDKGVAAKLSDFIDSFLQKDTRTWMGDHEHGGAPSAIDVHAMRDQGLIDDKLAAKMLAVHGLRKGIDFQIDSTGRASGPLYERLSERYEDIARHLNEYKNADGSIGFDGRTDWKPREVQALGWGATQKTHGVDPENLASAFAGNTRTFNLQVGADLTEEEAQRVAAGMAPHVEKIIAQTGEGSFPVGDVMVGVAQTEKKGAGLNASLHFQVMSSPEQTQVLLNRLARVFDRYQATAFKVGGNGAKRHLRIFDIPDEETAARVYASLNVQDKKMFKNGFAWTNGEMVLKLPGSPITAAEQDAFGEVMAPFIDRVMEEVGIERQLEYAGTNLQILKGESGAEGIQRADLGGNSLERRTDAQARKALDAAIRGVKESRTRRAVSRLSEERGSLTPGEFFGRPFAREAEKGAGPAPPPPRPRLEAVTDPRIAQLDARIARAEARASIRGIDAAETHAAIKAGRDAEHLKAYRAHLLEEARKAATPPPSPTPPPARTPRFVSEAVPRTSEAVQARIAELDSQLDPLYERVRLALSQESKELGGVEVFTGRSESAFVPGSEWGAAEWKNEWAKAHNEKFGYGPGNPNRVTWQDAPEPWNETTKRYVRHGNLLPEAKKQLYDSLRAIAAKGGENGRTARETLIKIQERDSLSSLEAKNTGAALFPEDVPVGGYGADLRVTARRPTPVAPERPRVTPGGGAAPPPPPKPPVARQLPSPEFDEDFLQEVMARVRKTLPSAEKQYGEQAVLRSEEKAARLKQAFTDFELAGGGAKGVAAMHKSLAGALPRLEWREFEFLDQDAYDALINHAANDHRLSEWEKIRVFWGLRRATEGRTPTPSEVALFRRTFGDRMADNVADSENTNILHKLWQLGMDIYNTPRSIMASFDLSAPFRQGLVAAGGHPLIFAKNFKPMIQAARKEENYLGIMEDIATRPNYGLAEQADLAIMDVHGSGVKREEMFPVSLAERTPILKHPIKGSSRAYSAFLSKLRMDIFDRMIEVAQTQGKDIHDPKFLKALGEYINTSTGRGKLPGDSAEKAMDLLNTFLFSPRLLASRFQILNPYYYGKLYGMDPMVARYQTRAALVTLGGISAMLYLAAQIPGVTVGLNPTSSDFGKIRFGNTRIDLAGGFQPLLVLYMRMARGEITASSTGVTRKLGGYGGRDRAGLLARFMEGKMAPTPGLVRDLLHDHTTFVGEPMTWKKTAINLLTPLGPQGAYDVLKEDGYSAAAISLILSTIGFGVAAYPDRVPSSGGGGGASGYEIPNPGSGGGYEIPNPGSGGSGYEIPNPP
jgi:hypothetical protein